MTLLSVKFRDFITLQRGFDLPKDSRESGPYPVVASTSVDGYHFEFKVQPPGVTTGRSGALGQVLYLEQPFWPLNTALWVKDFKGNLPRYVYYFLQTLHLERYNSGAGVPTLNRNHLDTLDLSVHSLPTQHKIAAILSAYDDLIEVNARRIRILEEMAQSLYREWFVRLRFPGHESARWVESALGRMPEGWKIVRMGDAFMVVLGGTPSRERNDYWENGTIPWMNSGKVNELRIVEPSELITDLGLAKSSAKLMPAGTTVVAITGATLGQVSILGAKMSANQSVVGIYERTGIYREYVYRTIRERIQSIIMHASGGAQQHINKDIVNDVALFLPSPDVLASFNSLALPIGDLILSLLNKNANLRATRDLLLPRLIAGEMEV